MEEGLAEDPLPFETEGEDLAQGAIAVAPHRELGVERQMDGQVSPVERPGQGVDQEGHVVEDRLDHRPLPRSAVAGIGIEDPELELPGAPAATPFEEREGQRRQPSRSGLFEVVERRPFTAPLDEEIDGRRFFPRSPRHPPSSGDGDGNQLALLFAE